MILIISTSQIRKQHRAITKHKMNDTRMKKLLIVKFFFAFARRIDADSLRKGSNKIEIEPINKSHNREAKCEMCYQTQLVLSVQLSIHFLCFSSLSQ